MKLAAASETRARPRSRSQKTYDMSAPKHVTSATKKIIAHQNKKTTLLLSKER
jgi:hypothetical protein